MGFKEDFFYYDPADFAFHGLLFFYLCQPRTFDLATNLVAYVPFGSMLFDRLIAAAGWVAWMTPQTSGRSAPSSRSQKTGRILPARLWSSAPRSSTA